MRDSGTEGNEVECGDEEKEGCEENEGFYTSL